MDNSLIFMRSQKSVGFPKNNFCFKIKYFKFKDGLSLFALIKTQCETTVKKCEKMLSVKIFWNM